MATSANFDPELVYVECGECGEPIMWAPGTSTKVLCKAGLSRFEYDSSCMILSNGCPNCKPNTHNFSTQVVRLIDVDMPFKE
ncbi:MAG: hypothetical protein ACNI3A_18300 [Desulfovibrio sp.]|uniref:hypothetical protein n=1 Tax=Desulfovibrio sp. 7SRBS1 TaxID=3378064 RepID=UPI003B3EA04A